MKSQYNRRRTRNYIRRRGRWPHHHNATKPLPVLDLIRPSRGRDHAVIHRSNIANPTCSLYRGMYDPRRGLSSPDGALSMAALIRPGTSLFGSDPHKMSASPSLAFPERRYLNGRAQGADGSETGVSRQPRQGPTTPERCLSRVKRASGIPASFGVAGREPRLWSVPPQLSDE